MEPGLRDCEESTLLTEPQPQHPHALTGSLSQRLVGQDDIYQDTEFRAGHKLHEPGQDAGAHHVMDVLFAVLGQVGQGPAGV